MQKESADFKNKWAEIVAHAWMDEKFNLTDDQLLKIAAGTNYFAFVF